MKRDIGSSDDTPPVDAPRPAATTPEPKRTVVGRYVVERRIADGGMGVVYAAHDPELNRPVALKLLRPVYFGRSAEDARLRLLREAQALARVTHPNVIAVYDVGRWEDSVFVAMELVDGRTIKQWLRDDKPLPRRILEVFRDAARGLAAVHRAGLVHRDFKPTNVMIGSDGRVRVLDFGLARAQLHDEGAPAATVTPPSPAPLEPTPRLDATDGDDSAPSHRSDRLLSDQLTRQGQILGTPAFMPPEQHRGEEVDARADQFSFCASLFWALYGELPFDGESDAELEQAIVNGRLRTPRAAVRVPPRARKLLSRGLSARAEARWTSMDAVVAELDAALRPSRVWAVAAAVVLVSAVAAVSANTRHSRAPTLCRGLDAEMTEVWNPAARARLKTALTAGDRAGAEETFAHVATAIDAYAQAWVKTRVDACEATQVRGVQSQQTMDLVMSCLGRGRTQLTALLAILSEHAERDVLDRAVGATLGLPPLSSCTDETALRAAVPPPSDPAVRADVEALEPRVASVQALFDTGLYRQGLTEAHALANRAAKTGYGPLIARAEFLLGSLQEEMGDAAVARTTLRQAATRAAEAKDDLLAAHAWIRLVQVVGVSQAKHEDAALIAEMAETATARAGRPPLLEAELTFHQGGIALESAKYAEAEILYRRALDRMATAGSAAEPWLPTYRSALAAAVASQGRYDEARPLFEQALADAERVFGHDHPRIGRILTNLGLLYQRLGDLDKSRVTLERALAVYERTTGSENPQVAMALNNLAAVLETEGRDDQALAALRRAVQIWSRPGAPESPDVCYAMTSLAGVLAKRGQLEEAWTVAENALRLFEQTFGRAHPDTAFAHATLADILLQRGRYREAETRYARALAIREKGGADPHVIAATLQMVAAAQVERGNAAAADASLARALALVGELADEGKKKRDVDGETSALVAAIFETRSAVRLRQDRAGDAAADAERALALREKQGAHNPTVAGALLRLAQAKGKQGRTDEARAALERALRLLPAGHPDVPLVLTELAAARLRSGERHDAESLLQRALALPAIATGPAGVRSRAQVLLAQARR